MAFPVRVPSVTGRVYVVLDNSGAPHFKPWESDAAFTGLPDLPFATLRIGIVPAGDILATPKETTPLRPDGTFRLDVPVRYQAGSAAMEIHLWSGGERLALVRETVVDLEDPPDRPVTVVVRGSDFTGTAADVTEVLIAGRVIGRHGRPPDVTNQVLRVRLLRYLRATPTPEVRDDEVEVDAQGYFNVSSTSPSIADVTGQRCALRLVRIDTGVEYEVLTVPIGIVGGVTWAELVPPVLSITWKDLFNSTVGDVAGAWVAGGASLSDLASATPQDAEQIAAATGRSTRVVSALIQAGKRVASLLSPAEIETDITGALFGLFLSMRTLRFDRVVSVTPRELARAMRRAVLRGFLPKTFLGPASLSDTYEKLLTMRISWRYSAMQSAIHTALTAVPSADADAQAFVERQAMVAIMEGKATRAGLRDVLQAAWDESPPAEVDFEPYWNALDRGLRLYRITRPHRQLYEALIAADGSLGDVAMATGAQWATHLASLDSPVPGSWKSTPRHWVRRLMRRAENVLAAECFAAKANADDSAQRLPDGVLALLDNCASARVLLWNLDEAPEGLLPDPFTTEDGEAAKKVARLARLAPPFLRYEFVQALRAMGIEHGAESVIRMGRDRFVRALGKRVAGVLSARSYFVAGEPATPSAAQQRAMADSVAQLAYERAEVLFSGATALRFQGEDGSLSMGVPWLVPVVDVEGERTPVAVPASWCLCDPCGDAFSPGAYLYDLLDFTKSIVQDPPEGEEEDPDLNLLQRLLELPPAEGGDPLPRRPDVVELELGCAETQTLLPQIDLVNELLAWRIATETSPGTAVALPTSTTGTPAQLRIAPVGTANDEIADAALSSAVWPTATVVHPPTLEATALLNVEGLLRDELMASQRWRGASAPSGGITPASSAADRAAAWLGLTSAERQVLFGAPTAEDPWRWFGVADAAEFSHLDTLTRNTGWSLGDIQEILSTRFANPSNQYVLVWTDDPCDLANGRVARSGPSLVVDPSAGTVTGTMRAFFAASGWSAGSAPSLPEEATTGQVYHFILEPGGTVSVEMTPTLSSERLDLASVEVGGAAEDLPDARFAHRVLKLWRIRNATGLGWGDTDRLLRALMSEEALAEAEWTEDDLSALDAARKLARDLGVSWSDLAQLLGGIDTFGAWSGRATAATGPIWEGAAWDDRFQNPTVFQPLLPSMSLADDRASLTGTPSWAEAGDVVCAGVGISSTDLAAILALPAGHPWRINGAAPVTVQKVQQVAAIRRWATTLAIPVRDLLNVGDLLTLPLFLGGVHAAGTGTDVLGAVRQLRSALQRGLTAGQVRYLLTVEAGPAAAHGPQVAAADIASAVRSGLEVTEASLRAELESLRDDHAALAERTPETLEEFSLRLNAAVGDRLDAPVFVVDGTVVAQQIWDLLGETHTSSSGLAEQTSALRDQIQHVLERLTWATLYDATPPEPLPWATWVLAAPAPERIERFDRLLRQWWKRSASNAVTRAITGGIQADRARLAAEVLISHSREHSVTLSSAAEVLSDLLLPPVPSEEPAGASELVQTARDAALAARDEAWSRVTAGWFADVAATPPPALEPGHWTWDEVRDGLGTDMSWSDRLDRVAWLLLNLNPVVETAFAAVAAADVAKDVLDWLPHPDAGEGSPEVPANATATHWLLSRPFRTSSGTPDYLTSVMDRMAKYALVRSTWSDIAPIMDRWATVMPAFPGGPVLAAAFVARPEESAQPTAAVSLAGLTTTRWMGDLERDLPKLAKPDGSPSDDLLTVMTSGAVDEKLGERLDRSPDELHAYLDVLGVPGITVELLDSLSVLDALVQADAFARRFHCGLSTAVGLRAPAVDAQMVDGMRGVARSVRDDASWAKLFTPIADSLRVRRRDAMVAWLTSRVYPDLVALQGELLMDPLYAPDVLTSRLVWTTEAVQALLMRAMLGLEVDFGSGRFTLSEDERQRYEWMRRFRLWEANRRIFFFPENWVEPELILDKSPLFEEYERALRKNKLDDGAVADALHHYIVGLAEIGRTAFISHYVEDAGSLPIHHYLGRTRSRETRHIYRSRRSDGTWTPWETVSIDVSGDVVALYAKGEVKVICWVEAQEAGEPAEPPPLSEDEIQAAITEYTEMVASADQAVADASAALVESVGASDTEEAMAALAAHLQALSDMTDAVATRDSMQSVDEYEEELRRNARNYVPAPVPVTLTLRFAVGQRTGWRLLPIREQIGSGEANRVASELRLDDYFVSVSDAEGAEAEVIVTSRFEINVTRSGDATTVQNVVLWRGRLNLSQGAVRPVAKSPAANTVKPTSVWYRGNLMTNEVTAWSQILTDDEIAVVGSDGSLTTVFDFSPTLARISGIARGTEAAVVHMLNEHGPWLRSATSPSVIAVDEQRAWLLELSQEVMVMRQVEDVQMTRSFDQMDGQQRLLADEVRTLSDDDDRDLRLGSATFPFSML